MNILSLFDGVACARVSLGRAGIYYGEYFSSEVDKYALEIAGKNFLKHAISLGDVRTVNKNCVYDIGIIIGGSPCQDLSISNKNRKGLDGSRSCLFWEYARLVKEIKPKYFILENVKSMPKEAKEIITKEMGVEPILINASLVSAQNRERLFWTNIPNVKQPSDRGIYLKDILLNEVDEKYYVKSNNWRIFRNIKDVKGKSRCLNASAWRGAQNDGTTLVYVGRCGDKQIIADGKELSRNVPQGYRIYSPEGKSVTLSANGDGRGAKTGLYAIGVNRLDGCRGEIDKSYPLLSSQYRGLNCNQTQTGVTDGVRIRKLTPVECERLQGLPDNYTQGISDTQRYRCLGNAFNVDVVAHILSFIPKGEGFYEEERENFDSCTEPKNEQSPVLHNGFCV